MADWPLLISELERLRDSALEMSKIRYRNTDFERGRADAFDSAAALVMRHAQGDVR